MRRKVAQVVSRILRILDILACTVLEALAAAKNTPVVKISERR